MLRRALLVSFLLSITGCPEHGDALRFEIPASYEGWVTLRYGVAGAPALAKDGATWVVVVSPTGQVVTSSKPKDGVGPAEFFAVDGDQKTHLDKQVGWKEDMTWDHTVACCFTGAPEKDGVRTRRFYVGHGPPGKSPQ